MCETGRMVKRQKEKQYQSAREHRANQSLRSGSNTNGSTVTRPLPFDCCALTLTPYTTPVCNSEGIIFDNAALMPHLMKYKTDPVTGKPMTSRDIIILNFDKDESTNTWTCPVLNKPFTNRTKVVAIRQTPPGKEANVYSYEAYHELNLKAKNNRDLISGLKFTKDDVIILQDPDNDKLNKLRDINNFHHTNAMREENAAKSSSSSNVKHSVTASRIMDKLGKVKRKRERAAEDQAKKLLKISDDKDKSASSSSSPKEHMNIYTDELITSMNLTSGAASGSLTSTSMAIARENKARLATQDEIITSQCEQLKRLKKKGMIRMFTNKGAMDIELHCDIVPRTTMNFIQLVEKGEYNDSKFHRSIQNFMIQGGKKPGVKDGGSSIWEKPFADEFDDRLKHEGSGVVAMANSGPATNGRQFYITYKSCAHLNRKHSVFGKVVGGLEILRRLEQIPTNKESDKPLETIKIENMEILDNPVSEALEIERERILKTKAEKRTLDQSRKATPADEKSSVTVKKSLPKAADSADNGPSPTVVGKYLKVGKDKKKGKKAAKRSKSESNADTANGDIGVSRLPPPPKKTSFGDFSGW